MFELLSTPFVQIGILVSLVLAGIHAYLGFHVVSRGVIFVDLSLAQAAAFGYVVALLLGYGDHGVISYGISLLFTLLGAFLISIAKVKDDVIPHEAFIGIMYAGFAALDILVLINHPEGTDILKEITNGSILTCSMKELIVIAILYSAVGFFHYLKRDIFFLISENRAKAEADGINVKLYDFLFYTSFGIVVTSSVHIAGVLLVFSLLVIPPVLALYYATTKGKRLFYGWMIAVIGALLGIHFSLVADLPAGPAIITALIAILILGILIKRGKLATNA